MAGSYVGPKLAALTDPSVGESPPRRTAPHITFSCFYHSLTPLKSTSNSYLVPFIIFLLMKGISVDTTSVTVALIIDVLALVSLWVGLWIWHRKR